MIVGRVTQVQFWSVTYRDLPQEEKPFSIDVKGERNFIREKHHHRGIFVYEVSGFPSMTKGDIVGHIVIDVNSRCHYDVMICCYDELSL
jgi:hypothetical protein